MGLSCQQRHGWEQMQDSVIYPHNSQYTLHWLEPPGRSEAPYLPPSNSDAAFMKGTELPKPSELLLHYNYGAAVVKWWGYGEEIFRNLITPPCLPEAVPAPMGLQTSIHDRSIAISKCDHAWASDTAGTEDSAAGDGTGGLVESEGQAKLDEDDLMLFFWGNMKATKEHHLKKVQENAQHMEQWGKGVSCWLSISILPWSITLTGHNRHVKRHQFWCLWGLKSIWSHLISSWWP